MTTVIIQQEAGAGATPRLKGRHGDCADPIDGLTRHLVGRIREPAPAIIVDGAARAVGIQGQEEENQATWAERIRVVRRVRIGGGL